MAVDGVYLIAWNLEAAEALTGWLVVEAQGGYNLEVDGLAVDQRRDCGLKDPETNWYRIRLARGAHRLRVEVASPSRPGVRVSVLDDRGGSTAGVRTTERLSDVWTGAEVEISLPPAERNCRSASKTGGDRRQSCCWRRSWRGGEGIPFQNMVGSSVHVPMIQKIRGLH